MFNFLRITFFSFTIWLTAAFINGALYASVFCFGKLITHDFADTFGIATFCSLVFSGPAALVLWLVFIAGAGKQQLSARLLHTAFIMSLVSCLFIAALPAHLYNGHWLLLSIIIVISSLLSVLLHHSLLQSFYHKPAPVH